MEMDTWLRPSPRPVFSDGIKEREGARLRSSLASPLSLTPPTHLRQLQDCKLATQTDASWLRANLFLDSTKIIFQTARGCCLDLPYQQRRDTLVHPSRWALASIWHPHLPPAHTLTQRGGRAQVAASTANTPRSVKSRQHPGQTDPCFC